MWIFDIIIILFLMGLVGVLFDCYRKINFVYDIFSELTSEDAEKNFFSWLLKSVSSKGKKKSRSYIDNSRGEISPWGYDE